MANNLRSFPNPLQDYGPLETERFSMGPGPVMSRNQWLNSVEPNGMMDNYQQYSNSPHQMGGLQSMNPHHQQADIGMRNSGSGFNPSTTPESIRKGNGFSMTGVGTLSPHTDAIIKRRERVSPSPIGERPPQDVFNSHFPLSPSAHWGEREHSSFTYNPFGTHHPFDSFMGSPPVSNRETRSHSSGSFDGGEIDRDVESTKYDVMGSSSAPVKGYHHPIRTVSGPIGSALPQQQQQQQQQQHNRHLHNNTPTHFGAAPVQNGPIHKSISAGVAVGASRPSLGALSPRSPEEVIGALGLDDDDSGIFEIENIGDGQTMRDHHLNVTVNHHGGQSPIQYVNGSSAGGGGLALNHSNNSFHPIVNNNIINNNNNGGVSSLHNSGSNSSGSGNNNNNNHVMNSMMMSNSPQPPPSTHSLYQTSSSEQLVAPVEQVGSPTGTFGDNFAASAAYGEHPLGEHPSRTLFVRNINSNVEDEELTSMFETYGPIRSMYTQCKHRGFVMISYYDIRHAKNAMRHLQGKVLRRRKLDIHYSIPKDNPSEKDQNQGTLVVFNLDPSTTNEELKTIFGAYGEIKEVRETPNKKHHKFIEFYDVRDAEKAMRMLNKTEVKGKKIKIEPSRPGGARKALPNGQTFDYNGNHLLMGSEDEGSSLNGPFSPVPSDAEGLPSTSSSAPSAMMGNFPLSPTSSFSSSLGGIPNTNNNSLNGSGGLMQRYASPVNLPLSPIGTPSALPNNNGGQPTAFPISHSSSVGSLPNYAAIVNSNSSGNSPANTLGNGSTNTFKPMFLPFTAISPTSSPPSRIRSNSLVMSPRNAAVAAATGNNSPASLWNSPDAIRTVTGSPVNTPVNLVKPSPSFATPVTFASVAAGITPVTPIITEQSSNMGSAHNSPNSNNTNSTSTTTTNNNNNNNNNNSGNNNNNNNSTSPLSKVEKPIEAIKTRHRSESLEDRSRYSLVLSRVRNGEDTKNTLMIRNIPNKYTQKMLLQAVDEKHKGAYDFFYLPIDFKNKCNVGYAFINFVAPFHIISFYNEFNNKKWEKFNSEKVCELTYARIQGKAALIAHFQNSSLMCEDKKCRPIIFNSGEQEPFPIGNNIKRRSISVGNREDEFHHHGLNSDL